MPSASQSTIKAFTKPQACSDTAALEQLLSTAIYAKDSQTASDSKKLMYFIDTLYHAIISKTQVTITSLEYKKSQPPLRQITFASLPAQEDLNPYALFWHNGKYYLLATKTDAPNPIHIRVDHILDIQTSKIMRDPIPDFLVEYFNSTSGDFLSDKYTETSPYLLEKTEKFIPNDTFLKDLLKFGPETECKLECRYDALDLLIDTFGDSNLQIAYFS